MKKRILAMAAVLSLGMSFTSFAAQWQQNATGWWWQNDDGSYPVSTWKEINGKWYYFDAAGYMAANRWEGNYYLGADGAMLTDTTTPDGYVVGTDGAWLVEEEEEVITVNVPEPTGYGVVEGCITYQYNKFVGTRGDVGAMLYLIPKDFSIKGGGNEELATLNQTNGKNGVYSAKVSGYGNYTFGDVPAGNYFAIIISKNTSSGQWFNDEEGWEKQITDIMNPYLTDKELEKFKMSLLFKKYIIGDIQIDNGTITTINHDFGNTYI